MSLDRVDEHLAQGADAMETHHSMETLHTMYALAPARRCAVRATPSRATSYAAQGRALQALSLGVQRDQEGVGGARQGLRVFPAQPQERPSPAADARQDEAAVRRLCRLARHFAHIAAGREELEGRRPVVDVAVRGHVAGGRGGRVLRDQV
eukprot:7179902-Prymnesium_polylepis.1